MKQSLRYGLLLTACALLSVRCASEALPGGGPPDKEPPVLLMSSVQNGATGVDPRQALRFEFSEPLNAASARKSITIFPVGEKTADIRIRQGRITITPAEVWEADVVYTVILGKNISDLRNNGLTAPVQVSFTTGPVMPQNRINGKVYGLKPNGTAVIAISRRTTVPAEVIKAPEFYTQTSPDGNFSFQYLPADIFTIAGYVDLDKSNSYEPRFDGTCVPRVPALTPDTLSSAPLPMLAVYDNYLEPKLLSAENLYPGATKLEFTKAPAPWNKSGSFRIDAAAIDTVLYHDRGCTLYHDALPGDTLSLRISGLQDHLDCALRDTVVRIPVSALKDSLYTFEQKNDLLFITPPPAKAFLSGSYQTSADTATLTLKRIVHGIYAVPAAPAPVRGNWQIRLAPGPGYPFMAKDTLYIVDLRRSVRAEPGAVMGRVKTALSPELRLVLENAVERYETGCDETGAFLFPHVLPGNYSLSYYHDMNGNGRPDPGNPYPFRAPEIAFPLDTEIQVRSRWDTELSGEYKIGIDKHE